MKSVSIKKLLGLIGITVAFAVVIVITLLYVRYAESRSLEKELDNRVKMTEISDRQPEYDIETSYGTIRVKLYNKTPEHLKNFEKLVKEHFYDSILFHRVINGFMIQTGDPYTKDTSKLDLWGQGGPGYTLPAEFVPEYTHKKGALAAARRGDRANPKKSSSGSQFYIVQNAENCMHLDGQYTVFGETIEGLDVIDRIAGAATDPYDRPYEDIQIITIRPVATDVKGALDSAAIYAGMDSAQVAKLDSLARAAGIDSTDYARLDSLAREHGLSNSQVKEGLKEAADIAKSLEGKSTEEVKEMAKDAAKEALKASGKSEKEVKDMAKKAIKEVKKQTEGLDLKKLDLKEVQDIIKK